MSNMVVDKWLLPCLGVRLIPKVTFFTYYLPWVSFYIMRGTGRQIDKVRCPAFRLLSRRRWVPLTEDEPPYFLGEG